MTWISHSNDETKSAQRNNVHSLYHVKENTLAGKNQNGKSDHDIRLDLKSDSPVKGLIHTVHSSPLSSICCLIQNGKPMYKKSILLTVIHLPSTLENLLGWRFGWRPASLCLHQSLGLQRHHGGELTLSLPHLVRKLNKLALFFKCYFLLLYLSLPSLVLHSASFPLFSRCCCCCCCCC